MFRDRLREISPRVALAGILATLIVVSFFIDEVTDFLDRREATSRYDRVVEVLDEERAANRKVETELLEGQDYLREQLRAVVQFIRDQGYDIPPEILTPNVTYERSSSRDDDDDDDDDDNGRDTTVVVPQSQSSSQGNQSEGSSDNDNDDDDVSVDTPDLPAPVGEATDTAKRIIEDMTGIDME